MAGSLNLSVTDHELATALAGLDDERLAALLAARPDLADPPPDDFGRLAQRAGVWASVYACYRVLDRWHQQVVQAMCLLPTTTTTAAEVAALLGADAEAADVEAALVGLADRALVLRDGDKVQLIPALAQLRFPADLGPPAASVLTTYTAGQLVEMAYRLGVEAGRTKTATLAAVATALSDPDRLPRVIEAGPPGTTEMMVQVLEHGPEVMVSGAYHGRPPHDRTALGWLMNRGVLAPTGWNRAVMPAEAGLGLRGGRPFPVLANRCPQLPTFDVGTEAVDGAAAQTGLRLVADVITVLDGWATEPPTVLKAGGLGIRDVRRVAKLTGRSDVEAAWIVELAAAARLVEVDRVSGLVLPADAYDNWLALEPARRWTALVAAWWAWPHHLAVAGAIGPKDKPIPPLLDRVPEPDAVNRRRAVVGLLAATDAGTGIDVVHLQARLDWESPFLWSGGPARPSLLVDWVCGEAELVGLSSHGALATAGRLVAAGLLDEAAATLAPHAPPVSSAFVIQADLTVVAPGELAAPVRADLELLADVESKGAATVYRLSESSLARGFEAGRSADDIAAFFESHATRGVPQSLTYLVGDLGRRFGRVRVGSANCYVRSDDPSLLAEVARSRRTAKLGLRLLAPTVAVADAAPPTVLATLQGAGYLPAPEDADGGLVLTRPEPRRAPPRPTPSTRRSVFDERMARLPGRPTPPAPALEPADLAALVDRLRKAPPPLAPTPNTVSPGQVLPQPLGRPQPALSPDLEFFDDDTRPPEIAKGRDQVELLLAHAYVEDWAVRLAYVNGTGRSSQLNVTVLEEPGDDVLVDCLPEFTSRTLLLDRIEWARVLTDAEEELLFP